MSALLYNDHTNRLFDLIQINKPDLFAITETLICHSSTSAELIDSTPPGYTLISTPHTPRSLTVCFNVSGEIELPLLLKIPLLFFSVFHRHFRNLSQHLEPYNFLNAICLFSSPTVLCSPHPTLSHSALSSNNLPSISCCSHLS